MVRSRGSYKQMTPNEERVQLYHKGTRPWTFSPENIRQAAERDIASKRYNAALAIDREGHSVGSAARKLLGASRKYAFLPKHVREANTTLELLQLAVEDRGPGLMSVYVNTVMIYDNEDTLRAALKLEGTA